MSRRLPRESLDYDTWLQQRAALTDGHRCPECGEHCNCAPFGISREKDDPDKCVHCLYGGREADDNVPDEADTDPDYD